MAAIRRILSGGAATGCGFVMSLCTQLLLVPIYISCWGTYDYGIWIILQSAFSLVLIIDAGHSRFLGNEFMRITVRRRSLLRRIFWSGVIAGLVIGGAQALAVWLLDKTGAINWIFGDEVANSREFVNVLFNYVLMWWVAGSIGGILVAAVIPFGHFTTTAWWGVLHNGITAIVPLLAAILGANIYTAGNWQILAHMVISFAASIHFGRILAREKIYFVRPSIKLMVRNLVRSQTISLQVGIEFIRMHWSRLIIAPLVGPIAVTGYSCMRTGANVVLAGLNSFIGPILPELMRYLGSRDQARTTSCCALLWSFLIIAILPASVILQICIQPLFEWWTRYKVEFDPLLFGALTCSVAIYALALPAMIIVHYNNLVISRLIVSAASSGLFLITLVWLVPLFGVTTIGFCLMLSEVTALAGYTLVAHQWLRTIKLLFPWRLFLSLMSVTLVMCISTLLTAVSEHRVWILFATGSLWLLFTIDFWKQLPKIAQLTLVESFAKPAALLTCFVRS